MTPRSGEHVAPIAGDLVVIQRNPTSGSGRDRRALHTLMQELRTQRFRVRVFSSRPRLDEFVSSPEVNERLRCLVAAGGDGTVASLAARHPMQPIAVFPMGTENLIARHLNMPRNGSVVARVIQQGRTREFDTARAGDHQFLLMASAGFDADIVRRLHLTRSGNIRHLSYLGPLLRTIMGYQLPQLTVIDHDTGREIDGSHVVISNFKEYALNLKLNPDADPTDGQLDVCVLEARSILRTILHMVCSLLKTQTGSHVVRIRSRHLTVLPANDLDACAANASQSAPPEIYLQTDGDPAGCLPAEISVNASAMRLLVHSR